MLRRLTTAAAGRVVGLVGMRPFTRGLYHVFIDGWGASFQDVDRALRQIRALGDEPWARGWERTAEPYIEAARSLEASGRRRSAASLYKRAALLFRIGDVAISVDTPTKRAVYGRCVAAYARYAELSEPPIERLTIVNDAASLTGYLHRPLGQTPAPAVIIVPGLGSSKEQPDFPPEVLTERGFVAFTMDLPGHGEAFASSRLHVASYQAVSSAIDVLSRHPAVDPRRISVLGTSLGGTVALKAAAEDSRIGAVVNISGFYEPRHWFESSARFVEAALKYVTGLSGALEVRELVQEFTLRGTIARITCPILTLHGDHDILIPVEEARQIHAEATAPSTLLVFPGGDHALLNTPAARYDVLDWLGRHGSVERFNRPTSVAV